MKLTRRNFVLFLLINSQLLSSLPTLASKYDSQEYDLIIVGSGLAGLTCGCLSLALGIKSVVIFEKEPVIGGTSAITNGFWTVGGTNLQKIFGIEDSDESLYKDMLDLGAGKNNTDLVQKFVISNHRQYNWVINQGLSPKSIVFAESKQRAHVFDIEELIELHRQFFTRRGGKIITSARVEDLVVEKDKVVGVVYEQAQSKKTAIAKKGVLLATGGFSRNKDMLKRYSPQLRKAAVIAGEGATGDGLEMALKLGAEIIDTEHLKASFGFVRNPSTMDDLSLIQYFGAIIVNQEGPRFVNESLPYKELADYALAQNGRETFVVFDERIRKEGMEQPPDKHIWSKSTRNKLEGIVFSAATVEEAAEKAGLNGPAVAETVRQYNERVKRGLKDDFGRIGLPGSDRLRPLKEIKDAPFYVFPTTPAIIGTYCGLRVDTHSRVLKPDGTTINGLWAAGEIMGGVHGASFMMGTALAKAAAFGRIAAFSIAEKEDR